VQANVTHADAVDRLVQQTLDRCGRSAIVVHKAGTGILKLGVKNVCRAHGLEGLGGAEASSMPDCLRATTNATTMIIGERVADFITAGRESLMDVQPCTIQIPDTLVDDLRRRLEATRWPGEIPGSDWDYGSNLGYMQELVAYWRTRFDWRAQEQRLNAFQHYKAMVDGLGIHFIHEKGKGPNPIPLVITHGWPGSFFEMSKMIPLLTDPGRVIAPS
jgi:hypothetical protein